MRRAVLLLLTLCNLPLAWAETYRWVDERGRVHYSDTMPSNATEQSVLDKQGRVRRKLPPGGGGSDMAEDGRVSARDIARERQDRALLSTYVHEGEIDLARDRALAHEKARQTSLQAMQKQVNERIARIEAEVAAIEQAGRRIPESLRQSRSQAQQEAARLRELLEHSQAAAAHIETRYEAYKLRFRELKGRAAEPRLGAAPAEGTAIP